MYGFFPRPTVQRPLALTDFFTNFLANEAPISESSKWLNGLADASDWMDVDTTNAVDGVHRAVGHDVVSGFNDPTAILKPSFRTFGNDQYVEGVIYKQAGYVPTGTYHEAELRLRTTLTAHSISGYEVLFAYNDPAIKSDGYAVVKWRGGLGAFDTIIDQDGHIVPPIADGDVFRVELRGTVMKVFQNGVQLDTDIDLTVAGSLTVIASGNPGVGYFPQTAGGASKFGWRSFKAGNL